MHLAAIVSLSITDWGRIFSSNFTSHWGCFAPVFDLIAVFSLWLPEGYWCSLSNPTTVPYCQYCFTGKWVTTFQSMWTDIYNTTQWRSGNELGRPVIPVHTQNIPGVAVNFVILVSAESHYAILPMRSTLLSLLSPWIQILKFCAGFEFQKPCLPVNKWLFYTSTA